MCEHEKAEWEQLGFPGRPVTGWGINREDVDTDKFDCLLRDSKGNLVLVEQSPWTVQEMLAKRYDRTFETVSFITDEEAFERELESRIPTGERYTADVFAILRTSGRPLTIPEREAAATIAWMVEQYVFSIDRGEKYILPKLFNDAARNNPSQKFGLPWKALSESKAFQLATLIERFYKSPTRVIDADGGYYVAVDATGTFEDEPTLVQLYNLLWILNDFDIFPGDENDGMIPPEMDGEERYNNTVGLSKRISQQANHAQYVEDTLGQVLAHLTGQEDMELSASIATGSELLGNIEDYAQRRKDDKLAKSRAKGANGKSTSKRRSAAKSRKAVA